MRVLAGLDKVWRAFQWFASVKKEWRWPRTSAVLIFDAEGHEFLLDYLAPWHPEVLHVRGERVNIPVLLATVVGSGAFNRTRYFDRFIERVNPRLIVTFVDNGPAFYALAARHPSTKTLFVQNGFRSYYHDAFEVLDAPAPARQPFRVDYMLTLGSTVGAEYARYLQGSVVPIGSLRNNLVPRRPAAGSGVIAFTSQYRNTAGFGLNGRFYTFFEYFEQADRLVVPFLQRYAKDHGKTLVIVPFFGSDPANLERERAYFDRLLGEPCTFAPSGRPSCSYEAADSSEVFVSIDSTLGYESAARGNRTALFPIRAQLLGLRGLTYGWPGTYPDEGPFWTGRPDPDAFERILDHLFAINDEQWQVEVAAQGFADLMAYDPGNAILQSVLTRELGPPELRPS